MILHRPDLIVLVSPLILMAALDWRPPGDASIMRWTCGTEREIVREGDDLVAVHRVSNVPAGVLVVAGRAAQEGSETWTSVTVGSERPVLGAVTVPWGSYDLSPSVAYGLTCCAGWVAPVSVVRKTVLVLPRRAVPFVRSLPRPVGIGPGPHPGLRAGDGTDFAGLRGLADGEIARRVHWPATLRTGRTVVVQTHQDTAGAYFLILDATAGDSFADQVRDIAGLCVQLQRDRAYVGLAVLGAGGVPPVPLGAGGRHLARLEMTLAHSTPQPGNPLNDYQHSRLRNLRLPPGTVVIAYSPLLDDSTTNLLARFAAAGYRVTTLLIGESDPGDGLSVRLDLLERRVRRLRLEAMGVPVTDYTTAAPSLTVALQRLRRRPVR